MEGDVNDITYSLPRLWETYNKFHDYPVVLFHDGMGEEGDNSLKCGFTREISQGGFQARQKSFRQAVKQRD